MVREVSKANTLKGLLVTVVVLFAIVVSLGLIATHPVTAQAKTKYIKVSVLVDISGKTAKNDYADYGRIQTTYKYNKNGLISKCSSSNVYGGAGGVSGQSYKYSNGKISKIVDRAGIGTSVFSRDKKGRVTKTVSITGQAINTYKYNKSGKATKSNFTFKNYLGQVAQRATSVIAYNKKGLISKVKTTGGFMDGTRTYTYDSRGMLKSESVSGSYKTTYKNTYKSGRLVKSVSTKQGIGNTDKYVETTVYKYKTIKVPKSYVAKVKDQQKALFKVTPPFAEKELFL